MARIPDPHGHYGEMDELVDAVVASWNRSLRAARRTRGRPGFWETDHPHARADAFVGALSRYDPLYRALIAQLLINVARAMCLAAAPYQR